MSTSYVGLRQAVADELGWMCHYCGCELTEATATLEHIVPRALGGLTQRVNALLACGPCNWQRGSEAVKCRCDRCSYARVHHAQHHAGRVSYRSGSRWPASERWRCAGLRTRP